MSFSEIFERYRAGTATEEEKKYIEDEIEKNELINEYLDKQIFLNLPELEEGESSEESGKEVRRLRRIMNRKIWSRITAAFTAAVLLIFTVSFACDCLFYDPEKPASGVPDTRITGNEEMGYTGEYSPLFLNATAFSSLFSPGTVITGTDSESLGFGRHNVWISSSDAAGRYVYSTGVKQGNITAHHNWFFDILPYGVFYDAGPHNSGWTDENGIMHFEQSQESRQMYREELSALPESSFIYGYISFEEDLTLSEFMDFMDQLEIGCRVDWAAVRTSAEDYFDIYGFDVNRGGVVIDTSEEFEEIFPYFSIVGRTGEITADLYETHFKTLLNYMTYQEDFLKTFCAVNNYSNIGGYRLALKYVEENGVNIFGAYIAGRRDAVISLEQMEGISSFCIDHVKLSAYQSQPEYSR